MDLDDEFLNEVAAGARLATPEEQEALDRYVARRDRDNARQQRRRDRIRSNGPRESYKPADVHARDGGVCWLCEAPVDLRYRYNDPRSMSIDHVVPSTHGGTDTLDNVRVAHLFCNNDRTDPDKRPTAEAASRLAEQVRKFEREATDAN